MLYFLTINYYSTELIQKLINSIDRDGSRSTYKFIIINNSPDDLSIEELQCESIFILKSDLNIGFGNACNLGLNWIYQQDNLALVWLINPDTYLKPNSVEKAVNFFDTYQNLSIVGTIIYTPEGKIWFAGGEFIPHLGAILETDLLSANPQNSYINCDWVSGCSLLIQLKHFETCPQFDPAYFLYYEDFDFCRRYASQGHPIAITDRLAVIHQPSSITNRNINFKLKHSTYSYLLTLAKYTNPLVFAVRFLRLLMYALILLPIKPQISLGKITGMRDYWLGDRATQKS